MQLTVVTPTQMSNVLFQKPYVELEGQTKRTYMLTFQMMEIARYPDNVHAYLNKNEKTRSDELLLLIVYSRPGGCMLSTLSSLVYP